MNSIILSEIITCVKKYTRIAHEKHSDLNRNFFNMWDEIEAILEKYS